MKYLLLILLCWKACTAVAQDTTQVPPPVKPVKISHAEPLYLDLVRDLGARKGEQEWNVGTSFQRKAGVSQWHPFIEYEFAPINRLGLEVEIPFQVQKPQFEDGRRSTVSVQSLKTSVQWTYAVIERWQTSLAVGYTNELELQRGISAECGFPFAVAAKRWGSHVHTLLYTAWGGEKQAGQSLRSTGYQVNLAVHYVVGKAFVGAEWYNDPAEHILRPQVRFALKKNLLVGLVSSISLTHKAPVSSFIRIIYEPKRRK